MTKIVTPEILLQTRKKFKKTTQEMADLIGVCKRYYEYREGGREPIALLFSNSFHHVRSKMKIPRKKKAKK